MKNSVLKVTVAALALTMGAVGVAFAAAGTAGDVRPVTGQASATSEAGSTAVLANGNPINVNDVVKTGPQSGVAVNFLDNSMVTIGENSEIVIDEFVYTGGAGDTNNIDVVVGAFRFASGQMDETGVTVETPAATLGFRGTIASGIVDANGNGFVNCEIGNCTVNLNNDTTEMSGGQCSAVSGDAVGSPSNQLCMTGDPVIDGLIGSGRQGYDTPWGGNPLDFPSLLDDLGGQQGEPSPNTGPGTE